MNDDGLLKGFKAIESGAKISRTLLPEEMMAIVNSDLKFLQQEKKKNEIELILRRFLLRQLIQVPGTFVPLTPVKGESGIFASNNCNMPFTKAVVLAMPLPDDTHILISKLPVLIPGVPGDCTTVPPLLVVPILFHVTVLNLNKQDAATTKNKALLTTSNLMAPFGYVSLSDPSSAGTVSVFDERTNNIPAGFLSECYYAFYDKSAADRKENLIQSPLFSQEEVDGSVPSGYTSKRFPILWKTKSKCVLSLFVDFV